MTKTDVEGYLKRVMAANDELNSVLSEIINALSTDSSTRTAEEQLDVLSSKIEAIVSKLSILKGD